MMSFSNYKIEIDFFGCCHAINPSNNIPIKINDLVENVYDFMTNLKLQEMNSIQINKVKSEILSNANTIQKLLNDRNQQLASAQCMTRILNSIRSFFGDLFFGRDAKLAELMKFASGLIPSEVNDDVPSILEAPLEATPSPQTLESNSSSIEDPLEDIKTGQKIVSNSTSNHGLGLGGDIGRLIITFLFAVDPGKAVARAVYFLGYTNVKHLEKEDRFLVFVYQQLKNEKPILSGLDIEELNKIPRATFKFKLPFQGVKYIRPRHTVACYEDNRTRDIKKCHKKNCVEARLEPIEYFLKLIPKFKFNSKFCFQIGYNSMFSSSFLPEIDPSPRSLEKIAPCHPISRVSNETERELNKHSPDFVQKLYYVLEQIDREMHNKMKTSKLLGVTLMN